MARIVEWKPKTTCPLDVIDYLTQHGVYYEHWDLDHLPTRLRTGWDLSGPERIATIESLADRLGRVAESFGYISYDLVILAPEVTPDLDQALETYRKPHHHSEDEVRLVIDGEVAYTMTANGATFTVVLEPGDLISIPAGVSHFFELTQGQRLKAVRLFQSQAGWVAQFDPLGVF
ncbi:MAG: cupin domain-containing protein [Firmicutes bacterium]|nr:cupin domain-containing protein [Bacillota bacterium]